MSFGDCAHFFLLRGSLGVGLPVIAAVEKYEKGSEIFHQTVRKVMLSLCKHLKSTQTIELDQVLLKVLDLSCATVAL